MAQEIPKVQVERENPSVPESTLWPNLRPKIIYKILQPMVAILRRVGVRLVICLDDMLILNQTKEGLIKDRNLTLHILNNLGWLINWKKISVRSNSNNRISRIQAGQLKYGSLASTGKNKQHPTEMPGIVKNIRNNNSRTS